MSIKKHDATWDIFRASKYTYIVRNDFIDNSEVA